LYYTPIAFLVAVVVGVIVSGITGWQKPEALEPALLSPLIRGRFAKNTKVRLFIFLMDKNLIYLVLKFVHNN